MVKYTTKAQRRRQREISERRPKKRCKGCKKLFRTVYANTQHMRTCAHALKASKVLEKYTLSNGGYIDLHISRKTKKPKRCKKNVEWLTLFSFLYGEPTQFWGCIHPQSGNLVICPKYWPNKIQIEKYFKILWKKDQLFHKDLSVRDKWGASVEIISNQTISQDTWQFARSFKNTKKSIST